jgi:hypothetical protein
MATRVIRASEKEADERAGRMLRSSVNRPYIRRWVRAC